MWEGSLQIKIGGVLQIIHNLGVGEGVGGLTIVGAEEGVKKGTYGQVHSLNPF